MRHNLTFSHDFESHLVVERHCFMVLVGSPEVYSLNTQTHHMRFEMLHQACAHALTLKIGQQVDMQVCWILFDNVIVPSVLRV